MARPLRIEYKGAWHHIMNRGAGKKKIFHTKKDYREFLILLNEITDRYQIQIHAYCLMPNHYHLLINTPLGNLSDAIKHVNGIYTQRYNRSQKIDGPLFRGRFKSILVEEDEYLITLSRYIHLNPVVADIVKNPGHYEWSSYPGYLNPNRAAPWIITKDTLNKFGSQLQRKKYRMFVEEGLTNCNNQSSSLLKKMERLPILGSKTFIKAVTEKHLTRANVNGIDESVQKQLLPRHTKAIIKAVAKYYRVNIDTIKTVKSRKEGNKFRAIAIYLSCFLSNQRLHRIASEFSNISCNGISKTYKRMKEKLILDHKLAKEVDSIKHLILSE